METRLEKQLNNILYRKIYDADRAGGKTCFNCIHAKVFGTQPGTEMPNALCDKDNWHKVYSLIDFARNGTRIYKCPDWEGSK